MEPAARHVDRSPLTPSRLTARRAFVLSTAAMAMPYPTPALGEADRCPHCGALAVLEASAALRWVCAVCGGARIPGLTAAQIDASGARAMLLRARQARVAAVGWRAAAIVAAIVAGMALLAAGLAIAAAAKVASVVFVALFVASMAASLAVRAKGRRAGVVMREELDTAYATAAETLARLRATPWTAPLLASALHVPEGDAEGILARLSASGRARVDVGDDAELRYQIDAVDAVDSPEEDRASIARETR